MTQIRKTLVSMVVLLAVAAALGAWAWFGVHEGAKKEQARKDDEARAFHFDEADVARVIINPLGAAVDIERDGDGWRIVSPVEAPADSSAVNAVVSRLGELRSVEVIAEDQTDLEAHGLDFPPLSTRLVLNDGTELELRVGDENPFNDSLPYVVSGDSRIHSTGSSLKAVLNKRVFDVRDKRLVVHDDDEVRTVEVSSPSGRRWSATRVDGGWEVTLVGAGKGGSDVIDRGDSSVIQGVLSRIRLARAVDFPSEDNDDVALRAYGLDRPQASISFTVGATEERMTLEFSESEGSFYTRRVEGGPIMEVESALLDTLDKEFSELRDRTVAPFDKEQVRRFEILPRGEEPIVVNRRKEKKDGVSWETEVFSFEGRTDKPKTWRLSSALYTLSNLKAVEVVEDDAEDLAAYGLDEPRFAYAVFGEDGDEIARVLLGNEGEDSRYYALRAGTRKVLEVEKSTADELPKSLEDVVDEIAAAQGAEAGVGE